MLRIAYIFDGFTKGGAQQAFLTVLPHFLERGITIDVYIIADSVNELELPKEIHNVFRLKAKNFRDLSSFLKLKRLIVDGSYNCLVANLYWSQIWSGLLTRCVGRLFWIEHNTYFDRRRLYWFFYNHLSRGAQVISVSQDVADFLMAKGIESKVIHNAVGSSVNSGLKTDRGATFLFAGRLINQKRPTLALEAFIEYLKDDTQKLSKAILHFCGDGPLMAALKTKVIECGVGEQVIFHGNISHGRLTSLMSQTSTLLSTSIFEGYALVRLEAVGQGMCVISTPTGGFRETLGPLLGFGVFEAKANVENLKQLMLCSADKTYWHSTLVQKRIGHIQKYSVNEVGSRYLTLFVGANEL